MKAEWIELSAWYGHVPFAFWLIENLQPKTVVELGTHYGVSFCAFNQAIQKLQLDTKSYAIDTWEGDEHSGLYGEEVYTKLSAYHDSKYGSFSRLVRSTFDRAVSHFPDKTIDLLHIDGLHTYEAVKHDYETWFAKLSDRSVVIFHDINVRERGFGVWKLWQELSQQYPHFSFLHYHGLGVLGVGDNLPETIKALLEANSNPELVFQIRESFARLGTAVAESWSKQEQQKEIAKLATQLQEAQTELSRSQQQLQQSRSSQEQLQQQLQQSRSSQERLQQQLQQSQSIQQQLQQQLQQIKSSQRQLQTLVAAMESSKFWQIRQFWFNLKQIINQGKGDELYQAYRGSSSSIADNRLWGLQVRYERIKDLGWEYLFTKIFKDKLPKVAESLLEPESPPVQPDPDIPLSSDKIYQQWLNKHYPKKADLDRMAKKVEKFKYKPTISIIVPVYNPPEQFLREAIESVLEQIYPHWELCLADDLSTKPYVRQVLNEYSEQDERIKVVFRQENGHISRASNSALEIAQGEYIALLDHDDLLTPYALYEVVSLLNEHPEADMIYSDEDKIDEDYLHREPFFKMDWCPDSFLSRMYTCHFGVYRRSLITEIGNFRVGFEGSQDYDLVLRFTEKTDNIFHIPKILYHWRIHSESAAAGISAKPYAYEAAKQALSEALVRRNESGNIFSIPGYPGLYRVRYEIKELALVSIIIPTKDLGKTLNTCLQSIFDKSTYPNYEIVLIDNGSIEPETFKCFDYWQNKEPSRFKCYRYDIPFNYSQINNYGVQKAQGEYLLFLNNDTEVITPDWIEAMVEQAQRPSIGAVGGLLLYPDKTIQHAGVVLGIGGVASHSHQDSSSLLPGYCGQVITINNYSAVTGACLMCRREAFIEVGGFEEDLAVAFNDVDFCLKLIQKGYRNIYLPHVSLYHYESKSRGQEDTIQKQARFTKEINYMKTKWRDLINNDPCYNPHLTRDDEDYSINLS